MPTVERVREAEERLFKACSFEEPDRVPVKISVANPFFCSVLGYTLKDFYRNLDICRLVQVRGSKWAFDVLGDDRTGYIRSLEQTSPDIGATAEGIIFNCEIQLPDEESPWLSPWIIPKLKTPEDVEALEVPDPKDCLYRLKRHYERAYGRTVEVMNSLTLSHPPLSAAGSLMGATRLYTFLYRHPNLMQRLFQKLLRVFYELIDYRDARVGVETRSIGLCDDHAGYLPESLYRRFVLPYNKQIYERYGKEGRSLHMDSQVDHIARILVDDYRIQSMDLGAGSDIVKVKEVFDGKVYFDGNLDTKVLVSGSLDLLRKAVEHCIYSAAHGGGYTFDVGGETYAGLDVETLRYMISYAKKIGRYPVRETH